MTATPAGPPTCPCCTFGNHTERCTCASTSCCHPAEHGSQLDRLHRQLVAARAEADGWAEASRNAARLYDQHLAEVRAMEQEAARRLSADGIRRVAAQSGWSGWAADYVHPDVDFDNDAVEAEHRAREEAIRAAALMQAAEWFDRYDTGVAALLRRMASDDTLMQASLAAYSTPKES